MLVKMERLRERVAELEQQNLELLRENAQLRCGVRAGRHAAAPGNIAAGRLGVVASGVVGGGGDSSVAVVVDDVVQADEDMPYLNGLEIGLDSVGTELYRHAKTVIPQGCGLISKRPESFLPERWPSFYEKASGPFVWDLSGNKYIDMCNAPGPYALGAADPDVNAAVIEAVGKGSFSTLNPPEEVELAEMLLELHPWCKGGMVRYARGGGEVNMLAARIARTATNRDRIAVCGYHGWVDWYIAANYQESDMSEGGRKLAADPRYTTDGTGHSTTGVPSHLAGSAIPWDYDRIEELRAIFEAYPGEIAAVMMEVCRSLEPPPGHLEAVRALCDQHGAVLIFDEVSSAWRLNLGGRHLLYNVEPDMCTFSKTISNGFAMAAVIGRQQVMAPATTSFISTSYHTERLGPAAAIATINKMRATGAIDHNNAMGRLIKEGLRSASQKAGEEAFPRIYVDTDTPPCKMHRCVLLRILQGGACVYHWQRSR
jgi:glutamate-1-semialdehyde 2,1-aminomutase